MSHTLSELAAYIEEHASAIPTQPPQEQFDHYEEMAIAILDGSWDDYPEGVLQAFLMDYLATKRKQLGL